MSADLVMRFGFSGLILSVTVILLAVVWLL